MGSGTSSEMYGGRAWLDVRLLLMFRGVYSALAMHNYLAHPSTRLLLASAWPAPVVECAGS